MLLIILDSSLTIESSLGRQRKKQEDVHRYDSLHAGSWDGWCIHGVPCVFKDK